MYFKKQAIFALLVILSFLQLSAQPGRNTYDSLWKKVDDLVTKKGLTQSALSDVKKIYDKAKKESDDAQVLKALIYRVNLQQAIEENAAVNSITELEKEIATTTGPSLSILYSILAKHYWTYFQQHRWQVYGRTATSAFRKEEVSTWTAPDFHSKISELYKASLSNKTLLHKTPLDSYDAIIIKGNTRPLRPTLYDLLANRALDYYTNDERNTIRPAYAFEITDEKLFAPAAEFSRINIKTDDSTSLYYQALLIYQELLTFHANDARPDALLDADIHRIELVYRHGVMEEKEMLYASALEHLCGRYTNLPAATQACYLLAQWHAGRAAQYNATQGNGNPTADTSNRYAYLSAVDICKKVLQQPEESEGRQNCEALLRRIGRKELHLETEKVNVPGQPFKTLVTYRNVSKIYLRILRVGDELKKNLANRYDDTYWTTLLRAEYTRNWTQAFPATTDLQTHSAEIKIAALPPGEYILVAGLNENFALAKNPLGAQHFHVSGISYITNGNNYFVLNRETGKPLAGAEAQVWLSTYDHNLRRNTFVKGGKILTDKNGYFKLAGQKRDADLRLELVYNNDRLFQEETFYPHHRNEYDVEESLPASNDYELKHARVFFFTDRAIYRPGQTVYFKGIAITRDMRSGKSKISPNQQSLVRLYGANGQQVDSVQVTTSEFGSYSGTFTLPEGVLTGGFRLVDAHLKGDKDFSVEEYKRPKFIVGYEKPKGDYKVNDTIAVTGSVMAYAGNNITGAQVTYRVVRQPRFIYPWLFGKWGFPRSTAMEITHGVTKTDADGKFFVRFKAIPDRKINKDLHPVFDYKVIANITDINGETRSGETVIPVSYKALQLKVALLNTGTIETDSLKAIQITTQNLAGDLIPAPVHITVYRLKAPARLIRTRYWQQPDQFVMSKQEHLEIFPNDEYQDEGDHRTWAREEKVYEADDTTDASQKHALQNARFKEGWHVVEVTSKDKFGEEVKDLQFIRLYDGKAKTPATYDYAWSAHGKAQVEPGEKSVITIGSSARDLFIIQHVDKSRRPRNGMPRGDNDEAQTLKETFTFLSLDGGTRSFEFRAAEDDRGGFGVYHVFVKNNRFFLLSNGVSVPWTNKELRLSYESFRDKTLPGSEEKWKMKIGGFRNEKVAAEMLVSMYDASLDQFTPHEWNTPGIWEKYFADAAWSSLVNFSSVHSRDKFVEEDPVTYRAKRYDQIIAQDQSSYSVRSSAGRGVEGKATAVDQMHEMAAPATGAATRMSKATNSTVSQDIRLEENEMKKGPVANQEVVQARKDFRETAFFFPELKTDSSGNIEFSFSAPEALTRWKFQALAHTKDAAFGYSTKEMITQKQLMVQPNAPRFLRQGDRLVLSTKIANMTGRNLQGTLALELLDAATLQPVQNWLQDTKANKTFEVKAGGSIVAGFSVSVPLHYTSALVYRFTARAPATANTGDSFSDAEESSLPVLTNNMLVTESLPLNIRGNAAKSFRLEKLLHSRDAAVANTKNSSSLINHALTIEFSSNPAWYAVQALPYLATVKFECADQLFNRYYVNALASTIAGNYPRIKAIFEKWKAASVASGEGSGPSGKGTNDALLSNLHKNQELKAILLEETPWVLDANNEDRQKKNIALLFDMVTSGKELASSLERLKQFQSPNGGFMWFKGGPDDRFVTQYILTGFGRLKKMKALPPANTNELSGLIKASVLYLDKRIKEDYDRVRKLKVKPSNSGGIGWLQVQYLYMRSFFPEYQITTGSGEAVNYFRGQAQKGWLLQNKYMQGMIALSLARTGDVKTAAAILKSLKENAIVHEELGMYWKDNRGGYYWHQAPVETQSLLIEAFTELGNDPETVDNLKTWLLKQKQTRQWKSTRATADACYALLLRGSDWLTSDPQVEIRLGEKIIDSRKEQQEAGTGYFKSVINGSSIAAAMGDITVKVSPAGGAGVPGGGKTGTAWGAVHWQYFEDLEKITGSASPLTLKKNLFVERNTGKGPVLSPVTAGQPLHIGDKIKVRIELTADRDMEYVHMKDMRASSMEPVNVLSGYKWQDGLGYYESTRDASTNFFFSWLPKGTYVFEYALFVTHPGDFSNGITSIQSLYAPEFGSHSEGVRVIVEE